MAGSSEDGDVWACVIDCVFRSVGRLIRRTSQRTLQDNCLALASVFPIDRLTDHVLGALDRFVPSDVRSLIRDQFLQISGSGSNRYMKGTPVRASGSAGTPPTAKPVR